MKIDSFIKNCATILDLEPTMNATDLSQDEQAKKLLEILNVAVHEICSRYVLITKEETITTTNCEYDLSKLTNLIKVKNVSQNGNKIQFKHANFNLQFDQDGSYQIEYYTYPSYTTFNQEIAFEDFNYSILVYSVCAMYSLSVADFKMFEAFLNKYHEMIEGIKTPKIFNLPQRNWQ